jgi:hypothetical protein
MTIYGTEGVWPVLLLKPLMAFYHLIYCEI